MANSIKKDIPDLRSEFIMELSERIVYWHSLRNKEADIYAKAYENVLHGLLTTDETE